MKKKTFPVEQNILQKNGYSVSRVYCPKCGFNLGTYNFGKAWCIGGIPFNERSPLCDCGIKLDWRKIPYPTGNVNPKSFKGEQKWNS